MPTRPVMLPLCLALVQFGCRAADPFAGARFIADGTENLTLIAKVIDARTRKPVAGATVRAIRSGRGTTLLETDSRAMPPPMQTNIHGQAIVHARFRFAADPSGYSVF